MTEESQEFQKSKVRYFTRKTLKHLPEMRMAKKTGLFPKKEGWRNVPEHMLVETEAADVLAETLGVPAHERKTLDTAAMLHDVYKRRERELALQKGVAGFDEAAASQSKFLRQQGYSDETIALTESVGHTSLVKFQNLSEIPLIFKIIHYVDDITLNNDLVPLDDRIDALEANPRYAGLNQEGVKIFGKPYFTVQREISKKIEQEFAAAVNLQDHSQLPLWIRNRILERIRKNE